MLNNVLRDTGRSFQRSFQIVTAGAAAASTAIAGMTTVGIRQFTQFERQMNEVFTLLPGISQDAMNRMSADVLQFSEIFGTLPSEVVPALYQALSAGVPQDNVFEFLEVAQQAALGGVTELQTAIDGITSVVNAYGADVINATEASDLMFTAVRLGKTTFEELSDSLFNVIPTASAVGVQFGEITAALATMTAQGTPTSVATTQLRQLLVELSRPGTQVAEIFERISGQSFEQFIASGGTVQEALGLLEAEADATGVSISALFSSVEAGNAALALTGAGAESFNRNLQEMENSAGATENAFNQMNQGIGQSLREFQASFQALLITIGERAAPLITPIIDAFTNFIRIIRAALVDGETLSDWLTHLPGILQPIARAIARAVAWVGRAIDEFQSFTEAIQAGVPPLEAFQQMMLNIFPRNVAIVINSIAGAIQQLIVFLTPITSRIAQWVQDNIKLEDVLMGVGIAITSVVVPALFGMGRALMTALGPIGLLISGISVFRQAWEADFMGIRTFITENVLPGLQEFGQQVSEDILPGIVSFIENNVMPVVEGFLGFLADAWEFVSPALTMLGSWFLDEFLPAVRSLLENAVIPAIQSFVGWLSDIWAVVGPALGQLANWFLYEALPAILEFISGTVIPAIKTLIGWLTDIWEAVSPALTALRNWFTKEGLPWIRGALEWFWNNVLIPVVDFLSGIWEAISPALGDVFNWFVQEGIPAIQGVLEFLWHNVLEPIINLLAGIWEAIAPGVKAFADGIIKAIRDVISWLVKLIGQISRVIAQWNSAIDVMNQAIDTERRMIESGEITTGQAAANRMRALQNSFQQGQESGGIGGLFQSLFSAGLAAAGGTIVRDFGGPVRAGQPVMIGRGAQPELFVPNQSGTMYPNADQMGGPQTVNYITIDVPAGGFGSQEEANEAGRMMVSALRNAGVEVG